MVTYKNFTAILKENSNRFMVFYLPNGMQVPAHYHITDVGSVHRYFIDCGGQEREENYVQIQLWLGKDINHRLNAKTILNILHHSDTALGKLSDLENSNIFIEYKTELITQYPVSKIEVSDEKILCFTENITTQCLAALRHEKELKEEGGGSDCCKSNCSPIPG